MNMLDTLREILTHPIAAGTVGAGVASRLSRPSSWVERVVNFVAGSVCAAYGSPALAAWMHVESVTGQAALAFVVGLFGLSLAAAITQGIRETPFGQVITGWISRRKD